MRGMDESVRERHLSIPPYLELLQGLSDRPGAAEWKVALSGILGCLALDLMVSHVNGKCVSLVVVEFNKACWFLRYL